MKTSNIYVRVEPNVKKQAEKVFEKIGIPMSSAVGMFLRQVIIKNGLPFEVVASKNEPLFLSEMTDDELDKELMKAQEDFDNGRVYTVDEVKRELEKEFGYEL